MTWHHADAVEPEISWLRSMHEDMPMQRIWFPAWLYRPLPLIYVIGGVLMFYLFGDETTGRVSGFLLFAAAALIWGLRLHARIDAARRKS